MIRPLLDKLDDASISNKMSNMSFLGLQVGGLPVVIPLAVVVVAAVVVVVVIAVVLAVVVAADDVVSLAKKIAEKRYDAETQILRMHTSMSKAHDNKS